MYPPRNLRVLGHGGVQEVAINSKYLQAAIELADLDETRHSFRAADIVDQLRRAGELLVGGPAQARVGLHRLINMGAIEVIGRGRFKLAPGVLSGEPLVPPSMRQSPYQPIVTLAHDEAVALRNLLVNITLPEACGRALRTLERQLNRQTEEDNE